MKFYALTASDPLWETAMAYARRCSWGAGPYLAGMMEENAFSDWERVVLGMDEQGNPFGFCTVVREDCIPDPAMYPLIGFVFIDERCRGRRLSQNMIEFASEYLKDQGFRQVYLGSDHVELYEKYGFHPVMTYMSHRGVEETAYLLEL